MGNGIALDLTGGNIGTGNDTDLRYLECGSDLNCTDLLFLEFRCKHTLHGGLDILNSIVDDVVFLDFYLFLFCKELGLGCRTDMETDDDGI